MFPQAWSSGVDRVKQEGTAETVKMLDELSLQFWYLFPLDSVESTVDVIFQKVA